MEKLVLVPYDKYQWMLVARGGSAKRETIPKVPVYPPPGKRDTLKSKKGPSPLNRSPSIQRKSEVGIDWISF